MRPTVFKWKERIRARGCWCVGQTASAKCLPAQEKYISRSTLMVGLKKSARKYTVQHEINKQTRRHTQKQAPKKEKRGGKKRHDNFRASQNIFVSLWRNARRYPCVIAEALIIIAQYSNAHSFVGRLQITTHYSRSRAPDSCQSERR